MKYRNLTKDIYHQTNSYDPIVICNYYNIPIIYDKNLKDIHGKLEVDDKNFKIILPLDSKWNVEAYIGCALNFGKILKYDTLTHLDKYQSCFNKKEFDPYHFGRELYLKFIKSNEDYSFVHIKEAD